MKNNWENLPRILTNNAGESIHISKQKAFYFAEEPSETFFIFSQKYILETLIPELRENYSRNRIGQYFRRNPWGAQKIAVRRTGTTLEKSNSGQ